VTYEATEKEKSSRCFRRSLFVVQDMRAGDLFTETSLRSIRPGYGLPTERLADILGRRAACDLKRGTPLTWDAIAGRPAAQR
jgi:sialic acid synthase SpsE